MADIFRPPDGLVDAFLAHFEALLSGSITEEDLVKALNSSVKGSPLMQGVILAFVLAFFRILQEEVAKHGKS